MSGVFFVAGRKPHTFDDPQSRGRRNSKTPRKIRFPKYQKADSEIHSTQSNARFHVSESFEGVKSWHAQRYRVCVRGFVSESPTRQAHPSSYFEPQLIIQLLIPGN